MQRLGQDWGKPLALIVGFARRQGQVGVQVDDPNERWLNGFMLYSRGFFGIGSRPEVLLSPILVRPVREQLEHDRVIRLLQAKYKRKSEVAINPGNQQTMPVGTGDSAWYPDLVLYGSEKNRKVIGVIEVETAESVNNLEAMSQWATFSRLKIPFHLYVPLSYLDVARRLCQDLQIAPPEIWTYQAIGEQIRFAMAQRGAHGEPKVRAAAPAEKPAVAEKPEPEAKPAVRPAAKVAAKPAAAKPAAARPAPSARRVAANAPTRAKRPVPKVKSVARGTPTRAGAAQAAAGKAAKKAPVASRAQKRR